MTMDMIGSQQYYQIFEDSYGRVTNGSNPNGNGIPTAPTVNKGVPSPSPIGNPLPPYTQHPGHYDGLGSFNPLSPVGTTGVMRTIGNNANSGVDGWGSSNYPGSELDFPQNASGIPPLTAYNPNTTTTRGFSPQQNETISVLNNYNNPANNGTNEFYNMAQQPGQTGGNAGGVATTSNIEMVPSSLIFNGNNGGNSVPYDQSLMLPSTINDDNRYTTNCSTSSAINNSSQPHLQQQQLHYNGNIALKVEPNTSLENTGNIMLLQSSTNSSTALTCNTINSSSIPSPGLIPPPSELVSTTSLAGSITSATNPNSFFQASPNYMNQSSPGSALSPSPAMNNAGGLGNYYNSHPPPASSTSPPSSLHSEFGDDAMGTSLDMMGSSTSITTSTSTGKRKSGGVSKAATSTTGGQGGGRGKRRKVTDQHLDPGVKEVKDKERRSSNNTRERIRIRDINDALTELGRVCMSLKPEALKLNVESVGSNDKPQTKLGVLNMAVEVITALERQVRERNLNTSAALTGRNNSGASTQSHHSQVGGGSISQGQQPSHHHQPTSMPPPYMTNTLSSH